MRISVRVYPIVINEVAVVFAVLGIFHFLHFSNFHKKCHQDYLFSVFFLFFIRDDTLLDTAASNKQKLKNNKRKPKILNYNKK